MSNSKYPADVRAKAVAFAVAHNREHGRGGATAAAAKFALPFPSVRLWVLKESGAPYQATASARRPPSADPTAAALRRMADVRERIAELERELDALRAEYAELKATVA